MNIKSIFKEKSGKNIIAGLLYQIVSILMGLILPYLFITELGSETNGLMNSIGQAFTCLGLLEAGVGSATLQALYKPISCNDHDGINGVLAASNHFYRKTGFYYSCSVVLLSIIYPYVVNTEIDSVTIRLVIVLQGTGSVITYVVQAKYSMLLGAEGKEYIKQLLLLITAILRNTGKIIAIKVGYGIVAVQIIHLSMVVFEAVFFLIYIKKNYKWIDLHTKPNFKAIESKSYALINSISWMVFNHTDILVLTIFARDLTLVSIYSVYMLLFETGYNFLSVFIDSFQYKLGLRYQEGIERFENYYLKLNISLSSLSMAIFLTIYIMSMSFVTLYTKSATDADYLINWVPELFLIYKSLYLIRQLNRQIIIVNGDFKKTSVIAIAEASINVIVSILLVIKYGIIGVLIGTIAALFVSLIGYLRYMNHLQMRITVKSELCFIICFLPIYLLSIILIKKIPLVVSNWLHFIIASVVVGILCLLLFGIILLCFSKVIKRMFNAKEK